MFKVYMPQEVDAPLLATLHSGHITQGTKVDEFERDFGKFVQNPYVVSVNSATSALTLALRLAGVKSGSEVVTTPMTCTATNLPILSLGAKPVFADIDPKTGLIDPKSVKSLITNKTKAIMCCDWGGTPCELDELMLIAREHKIKLIEDAAHALGAEYKNRRVGSVADFTCFSFQAIKHISTVDGGMLACLNKDDYEKAKLLRWFGIKRETGSTDTRINEDIQDWGYKFHMNDVTATIGIEQIKHIEFVVGAHRANALYYNRILSSDHLKLPVFDNKSAYWLYTILLPNKIARDKFKEFMTKRNIQVSEVHRRNDSYSVFKPYANRRLPGVDAFSRTMVCLPVNWSLNSKDLNYIVKSVSKFLEEYNQWL